MIRSMHLLVGEVFRRAAAVAPRRPAASLGDRSLTFAELNAAGNRVAHALSGLGIGHGDRVAWWGHTSLEPLPVFVGLTKLGAAFAPVNALLGPDEAAEVVALARPSLLVTDAGHAEAAQAVAEKVGVERLARTGGGSWPGSDLEAEAARASNTEPVAPELTEGDPHVIFFTSGSTGRPKGVVLSHRANCLRTWPGSMQPAGGPTVCMFPLFHMAGWSIALGCWQQRQEVVFVEQATAEQLLDAVQRSGATRLYAIPAVWDRILATDRSRWDLSGLAEVDTGTSATPPELIDGLKRTFPGTTTRVFYGSTEGGPGTVLHDADLERKPGSVGLPSPGIELRLSGEGEVLVRSPFLMNGYFDDPEATAEALAGGWYHTGDLGTLDDEGYLSIVGRVREVIRTGGEAVAPAEVEEVVTAHPAVREAAVIGLPDPTWGEVVCAAVVLENGAALGVEELQDHCRDRLAPFKLPRRLEVLDALPRTPATGQVQRTLLADRLTRGHPT